MIIYKVENKCNHKIYIGQTTKSFNRRKGQHLSEANSKALTHFHKALKKWGFNNFEWTIIFEGDATQEQLNLYEKFYIQYYDSLSPNGYNHTTGGDHKDFSTDTKERIRSKLVGRIVSEETRQKLRESLSGRPMLPQTREALLRANTGRAVSDETKEKIRNSNLGKTRSLETRINISKAQKGKRTLTPEQIKNLIHARHLPEHKKPRSEEHRKNLSLALRGKKRSEEFKRKISLATKGKKLSEAHKENIRKAQKRRTEQNNKVVGVSNA